MSKLCYTRAASILGGLLYLSGCVGAPSAPPPPPPAPPPAPAQAPAPLAQDWRDWPVNPGDWSYRAVPGGTIAIYAQPGQSPLLSFRCELSTHRISVERATPLAPAQIAGQMVVRTSFGDTQWPIVAGKNEGAGAYAAAVRAANDMALDRIAFSRGRFAIEVPGANPVVVPNWAEVSRVIEDCRG